MPILIGSTHSVFEGHGVRNVTAVLNVGPTDLLTVAAPGLDPGCHLSRFGGEVPAPRECPDIERQELVCRRARRTPTPAR
jgi:hypothetical protein